MRLTLKARAAAPAPGRTTRPARSPEADAILHRLLTGRAPAPPMPNLRGSSATTQIERPEASPAAPVAKADAPRLGLWSRIRKAMQFGLFGGNEDPEAPGSRGGKFYRTKTGHVKYGEKPIERTKPSDAFVAEMRQQYEHALATMQRTAPGTPEWIRATAAHSFAVTWAAENNVELEPKTPAAAASAPTIAAPKPVIPAEDYQRHGARAATFKAWFGDWERDPANASKVVNEKGEPQETYGPLRAFHGTPETFTTFDPVRAEPGLWGTGFYFTEDRAIAQGYQTKNITGIRDDAALKGLARFVRRYLPENYTLERHVTYLHGLGMTRGRNMVSYSLHARASGRYLGKLFSSDEMGGKNAFLDYVPQRLGWTATPGLVETWKRTAMAHGWPKVTGEVHECYLNVRKPFIVDQLGESENSTEPVDPDLEGIDWPRRGAIDHFTPRAECEALASALDQWWRGRGIGNRSDYETAAARLRTGKVGQQAWTGERIWRLLEQTVGGKDRVNEFLAFAGYDGVSHVGGKLTGADRNHRVWIIFQPTQAKAVANTGTFNPADPDLFKARLVLHVRPRWRPRLVLKAHVKQYTRVSPTSGQPITVHEHDDRRRAAQHQPAGPRRPAAAPTPPHHRLATIHTGGPGSPGHTVRLLPHPQEPGRWQVHEGDAERAQLAMQPQQMPQPAVFPQMREARTPPPPGQFYSPNPAGGRSARVGVPGMHLPPPPPIPRLPNLAPDERRAESTFAEAFEKDPEGMVEKFLAKMKAGEIGDAPNIFATDEAKHLSGDWNPEDATPEETKASRALYNTALHQTANAICKRAFVTHLNTLAKLPPGSPERHVLVTAGGVAAGKGFALEKIESVNSIAKQVGAVWDSAGDQNSTECEWVASLCEERNIPLTAVYVHANPDETWTNPKRGVVERANSKGRMVDARIFADSYDYGAKVFETFAQARRHSATTSVFYIDNSQGAPQLVPAMPPAALQVNADQLYAKSLGHLHQAQVSPAVLRGGSAGTRIWSLPPAYGAMATAGAPSPMMMKAIPPDAKAPKPPKFIERMLKNLTYANQHPDWVDAKRLRTTTPVTKSRTPPQVEPDGTVKVKGEGTT